MSHRIVTEEIAQNYKTGAHKGCVRTSLGSLYIEEALSGVTLGVGRLANKQQPPRKYIEQ